MKLPDPVASRAVLIGSYSYHDLEPLPAVANNLERLRALFTSADLWGLPARHCVVAPNPSGPAEVLDLIHDAAAQASDTLLVYYAGHGLVDPHTDDLYLALPASNLDRLYTAVRFEDLRREMVMVARALSKVVILDCCYSGRAMAGGMSGSMEIADQARIEGTYLMTASAETVKAQAPLGEEFTAFTSELVTALGQGIPDGPDLLNVETLYWHVRKELVAKFRPTPQQRAGNDGGMIVLARNRRGVRSADHHARLRHVVAELPAGSERYLHCTPREVVGEVERLVGLDRGAEAGQLLAALAVHRQDQEVAVLIAALRQADRGADAEVVIGAAARRPAEETVALIRAQQQIGAGHDADLVLDAVASRSAEDAGAVAEVLNRNGSPGELRQLLDSAIAAHRRPEEVIALVATLLSIGLGHEVSRLLDLAIESMAEAETAALADALRGAGRDDAAFRLYGRALGTVARRPAKEVASLVRAMRDGELDGEAEELVDQVCAAVRHPGDILGVVLALRSASLDADARWVLEAAAPVLEDEQVVSLAGALREHGRHDSALHLCVQACTTRPVLSAVTFVHALREAGRPVDSHLVLDSSRSWPAAKSAELVATLRAASADADARRVLTAVAQSDTDRLCQLAVELRNQGSPEDAVTLIALADTETPEAALALALALSRQGLTADAQDMLVGACARSAGYFCDLTLTLQAAQLSEYASHIFRMQSEREVSEVSDRLDALQERGRAGDAIWLLTCFLARPIADVTELAFLASHGTTGLLVSLAGAHPLIPAMRAAGLDAPADRLLRAAVELLNDQDLLAFIGALDSAGQTIDANNTLQTAFLARPISFAWSVLDHPPGPGSRKLSQADLSAFAAKRPIDDIAELYLALRLHQLFSEAKKLRNLTRQRFPGWRPQQ